MREDRQRRQARGHAVVVFTVADGAGKLAGLPLEVGLCHLGPPERAGGVALLRGVFPPGAGHAACREQAERIRAENQAAGGVVAAADWVEGATVDWQEGG
jgi:hypothetical protein